MSGIVSLLCGVACCVCSASNDKVSLTFDDKSKEIDRSPTIVDSLTRSPANPSMVCVCVCACVSACMCTYVCVRVNFNWTRYRLR